MAEDPPHSDSSPRDTPEGLPRASVDDGWGALSSLLTGILVCGGAGWLADRLLGTAFLLPIGLVVGAGLSIYTIFLRFSSTPGKQ